MADATVGALKYRFEADISGLKAGIASANDNLKKLSTNAAEMGRSTSASAEKVGKSFKDMSEKVASAAYELGPWTGQHVDIAKTAMVGLQEALGTAALAFAALSAAAVAALSLVAVHAVRVGEEAERAKSQFGLTGDGIAKLSVVASRAGTDLDTLASALKDVSDKAKDDDDDLKAAAEAVGLSVDKLKTKDLPSLLRTIQGAYSATGDSANKYAAFQKILGDSFEKLYPVMQQGVGYMDRLYEAAMRSGTSISGTLATAMTGTISAVREAGASWEEFKASVSGASLALYEKAAPAINATIQYFSTLVGQVSSAVQAFSEAVRESGTLSLAMDVVTVAAKAQTTALIAVAAAFSVVLEAARGVMTQVVNLINGGITAANELWKALTFQGGKPSLAFSEMGAAAEKSAKDSAEKIKGIWTKAKGDIEKVWTGQPSAAAPKNLRDAGDPEAKESSGGGGKSKAAGRNPHDSIKQYIAGLEEAKKLAQVEADTWNKSNVERAKAVALVKAEAIAQRDKTKLTEEDKQQIEAAATATTQLKDKTEALKKAQEDIKNIAKQWADTFASALDDLIVKGKKFGDVLKDLLKSLASMALKGLLTGSGSGSGIFGALGDIFSKFVGGRATGGPIGSGKWGLVGENGPELISGGTGGVHITPFDKMGGGGGGRSGGVIVHNYAAGVEVTPRVTPQGVMMIVREAINQNNHQLPGFLAERQARSY